MNIPPFVTLQVTVTGVAIVTLYSPGSRQPIQTMLCPSQEAAMGFLESLRRKVDSTALVNFQETIMSSDRLRFTTVSNSYHVPDSVAELFLKLVQAGQRQCAVQNMTDRPLEAVRLKHAPRILVHACAVRTCGHSAGSAALVLYIDQEAGAPSAIILGRRREASWFLQDVGRHFSISQREQLMGVLDWLPQRGGAPYYLMDSYTAALLHVGHWVEARPTPHVTLQ